MTKSRLVLLLSVIVLTLGAKQLMATTAVVGSCKPGPPTYPTITAALAATLPPFWSAPAPILSRSILHIL